MPFAHVRGRELEIKLPSGFEMEDPMKLLLLLLAFGSHQTHATTLTLSDYSPPQGAIGVNPNGQLAVGIVDVGGGTVTAQAGTGTITVTPEVGAPLTFDVQDTGRVSFSDSRMRITPASSLDNNRMLYTVTFPSGTIQDTDGNAAPELAGTQWQFTTYDAVQPVLTGYSPAQGATDVARSSNIVLTFNENTMSGQYCS